MEPEAPVCRVRQGTASPSRGLLQRRPPSSHKPTDFRKAEARQLSNVCYFGGRGAVEKYQFSKFSDYQNLES